MNEHVSHTDSSRVRAIDSSRIALPAYAAAVLEAVEDAGFEAWCVGGFVRDAVIGRPSHDIDIATSAHWTQVKAACGARGMRTHETGVKHGTLTVVPDPDSEAPHAVEVTTYRIDGSYDDARHPKEVFFVSSIEEDLARRDFTMNAMAYHPTRGLYDPYHGRADIDRGIIRIVGEARTRFSEDALRILRAARFSSQLGYAIEPDTLSAMTRCKHLLSRVSVERVTHEFDELLMGDHVHDALMATTDTLSFVMPELFALKHCPQNIKYHCYNALEHTAWAVQHAPKNRLVRWAVLCHDFGKPAALFYSEDGVTHFYDHALVSARLIDGIAERFLMGSSFKTHLKMLVRHHDDKIEPSASSVKRLLMKLGGDTDLFYALCDVMRADAAAHAPGYQDLDYPDALARTLDKVIEAGDALTVRDLAINGFDLMEHGYAEGPAIGRVLRAALEAVISERVPNDRESLLAFAVENA